MFDALFYGTCSLAQVIGTWFIILMIYVVVIGCLDRLFVQVWCMVDALVYGIG
jgi:hypothetical protein